MRRLELIILLVIITAVSSKKSDRHRYRAPVINYPKDTQFWATDFWVTGCKNFLNNCPKSYKQQIICGRNFDGDFRTFDNYCIMQYENCNSWRNWRVFKREKC